MIVSYRELLFLRLLPHALFFFEINSKAIFFDANEA